jgi:hypothetical protein
MTTEELFRKVDGLKAEHAKLEGQMETHLKQLNTMGYNNLAAAEAGLVELRASYAKIDGEISERTRELERLVGEYESAIS